jgi:competence protein ComEA
MHTTLRRIAALFLVLILAPPFAGAVPGEAPTVNVNTESAAAMAEVLDGIGLSRAQAIVEHREAFGEFSELDDLLDVKGIGEKILTANAERIRFK